MIRTIMAMLLLVVGVTFIVIASIGVARLPDVFQRMHASTKAGGIGTSLVVLGVMVAGGIARPATGATSGARHPKHRPDRGCGRRIRSPQGCA